MITSFLLVFKGHQLVKLVYQELQIQAIFSYNISVLDTKELLKDLNEEQKKAVTHKEGPLLIIAGAGTGKTKVITTKIAYLIAEKIARPEEIVALTFTEKAAAEMEERVDILVPYGYTNIWISTFHSFGDRILRENAIEADLPPDFNVLDEAGQAIFLRDHLFEFDLKHYKPLANPTKHIKALIAFFSRLKDEVVSPQEFLDYAKKTAKKSKDKLEREKLIELAKAYDKYEALMRESGNVDYGDQVVKCIELFRKNPKILKNYHQKFKYVLVDEFQDTNYAQNELLKILAKKSHPKDDQPLVGNITVVGDDDQSIFRFRGAAVSNILDFKKTYPKAKEVVLTQNYRSTEQILNPAYKLIQHNNPDRLEVKYKIDKKLKTSKKGREISHIHCDSYLTEADKVAEIIEEKVHPVRKGKTLDLVAISGFSNGVRKKEYTYKDFAILFRANNHSEPFIHALNAKGIPYKFSGGSGLYQRPEVRVIISFINSLTDFSDNLSFYHLATSQVYGVDPSEIISISSVAKRGNKYLRSILKDKALLKELNISEETEKKLEKVVLDLEKLARSLPTLSAGQLIYQFLKDTGFLSKLLKENSVESEVKIQNIAKFFEKVRDFEQTSFDKSILKFKEYLDMLLEAEENPELADIDPDLDAVNLLTIHKAKGLEFDLVFLINLVLNRFPQRRRGEAIAIPEDLIKETLPSGDYHLEEERRLFYVGMTRAKKELYLTSANDYGGARPAKLSQFVLEALDKPLLSQKTHKLKPELKIEKYKKREVAELPSYFFTKDGRLNLSPHQIDDYLSCPLKFKYVNILKVPILRHHSVHYGSAIHSAIANYFSYRLSGREVSLENLWEFFEKAWVSEGFITREHEEERLRAGREALKNFYDKQKQENRLPQKIEEKFSFNLKFEDGSQVRVNGRFDVIYKEGEFVEISDFKTSEVAEKEKADLRTKQSLQLAIYALAYKEMEGKLPDKVSLCFIESGLKGETQKTEKDLGKIKKDIFKVSRKIREAKFDPLPSYKQCSICAFKDICPYTETKI